MGKVTIPGFGSRKTELKDTRPSIIINYGYYDYC